METEMGEVVSQNEEASPQMLVAAFEAYSLYATRMVNREVWKAQAFTISSGAVIGYTGKRGQQRKRVHLGYAMGCVKEDHATLPDEGGQIGLSDDARYSVDLNLQWQ